jgi:hypothetical protein
LPISLFQTDQSTAATQEPEPEPEPEPVPEPRQLTPEEIDVIDVLIAKGTMVVRNTINSKFLKSWLMTQPFDMSRLRGKMANVLDKTPWVCKACHTIRKHVI